MADILVVDDDPEMVTMLQAVLERQGHSVLAASNGVEALEILQKEEVHLVVTDMHMPELDGFELIPALLERFPEQRIVAMSGAAQWEPKDNLNAALDLGAVRCVEKPFDLDVFYGCVEELVS